MTVYTIGHSTRAAEQFISLLHRHAIRMLVDTRSIPRSRRNPQFNREVLPETLAAEGISYTHMAALGGLRKPKVDSINTAWRNDSFRGYADYMLTDDFKAALIELLDLAGSAPTAVMCAEAVYWQCHRSLIADALVAHGHRVEHITDKGTTAHKVTSFARVEGTRVTYPSLL